MPRPYLVAETPRAGKLNHRFVVQTDCELNEQEITRIIGLAKNKAIGSGYLSVSKDVMQHSGGRVGTEILVFAGLDTSGWPEGQKEEVLNVLQGKMILFDQLVGSIDWKKHNSKSVIQIKQLEIWQKKLVDFIEAFPESPAHTTPPLGSRSRSLLRRRREFVVWVLVLCIAVAAGAYSIYFASSNERRPGIPLQQEQGLGQKQPAQDPFRRLRGELDLENPDELAQFDAIQLFCQSGSSHDIRELKNLCRCAVRVVQISSPGQRTKHPFLPLFRELKNCVSVDDQLTGDSPNLERAELLVASRLLDWLTSSAARELFKSDAEVGIPALRDYISRNIKALEEDSHHPMTAISETANLLLLIDDLAIKRD